MQVSPELRDLHRCHPHWTCLLFHLVTLSASYDLVLFVLHFVRGLFLLLRSVEGFGIIAD